MTWHLGDLVLALTLLAAAVSAASLGVLLKRAAVQAVAEWQLGRSLMRQLDETIEEEQRQTWVSAVPPRLH